MSFLKAMQEKDNSRSPSKLSRLLAVPLKTNYKKVFEKQEVSKKVLFLCTERSRMEMDNEKIFLTGNHPTEHFVP